MGSEELGWEEAVPAESKVTANGMLARLESCETRDEAELLRGRLIGVPRGELPKLPEGEHYWYDLIGLRVLDESGDALGTVADLMETGSNDVLLVEDGRNERILLPYVSTYVIKVDLQTKTIHTRWHKDY